MRLSAGNGEAGVYKRVMANNLETCGHRRANVMPITL